MNKLFNWHRTKGHLSCNTQILDLCVFGPDKESSFYRWVAMVSVQDLETGEASLKTVKDNKEKYETEENAIKAAVKWYLWGVGTTEDGHTW